MALLTGVPLAFVALFFAWPLGAILARGTRGRAFGEVLGRAATWRVVWFTTWQAALCSLLAVLVGLAPAWVLARYRVPGRRALLALTTVPFMLPTIVVGSSFLAILPSDWHRSIAAIIVAHVWVNLAVVVRTVGASVAQFDPRLGEAAATLGASPTRRLLHVHLPLMRPALLASSAVVFLFCFTSFGIVRILGGPAHPTLEVEIWRRTTQSLDLSTAAVLGIVQLLLVSILLLLWTGAQARRSLGLSQRIRHTLRAPTRRSRPAVLLVLLVTATAVLAPLVVMVARSFTVGGGVRSLDAWRSIFGRGPAPRAGTRPVVEHPLDTMVNSLKIAVVAAAIAVVIATMAACAIAYSRGRGRILDTGLMLPLGTSAVTVGFGLIITFNRHPVDLRGSWIILPIAQALVSIPFAIRVILPTLRAIDPRQREAAAVLGASPGRTWLAVDLPILRRAVGAAAGFAFAMSVGEFGATSFLTRVGNETAPIAIGRLVARPGRFNLAQAYALATMLAAVTLVVVLIVDRFRDEKDASF